MRRSAPLILMVLIGLSSGLSAQNTYRLPQIANGAGAISTTFVFFNNGDQAAIITITLTDDDGSPLAMNLPGLNAGNVKFFTLQPGETRFIKSDGLGDLQIGAALVNSTQPIGVSAIFSLLGPGGTTTTEAGIGASQEMDQFAIAVDTMGPFNTGIAVFNTNSAATLTFQLFDKNGNPVGQPAIRQISQNGHLAVFVDGPGGLFPALGDFQGKMVVTASRAVAALTLRQNVGDAAPLTTLPAVRTSSSQTEFALPQIANGTGIKTQFVFFSLGSLAGNINLKLTDNDGNPFNTTIVTAGTGAVPVSSDLQQTGSEFNFPIPGNGVVFVETDGQGTVAPGAARVVSTVPIGVSAIFSLLDGTGKATVEAGVGDSPSFTEFTLPADLTNGLNTGVALFNNSGSTSNVAFQFIDQNGQIVASSSVRIGPETLVNLGHLAKFADQLVSGVAGKIGQLAITATEAVSAITLRQGATTLTTLPVVEGTTSSGGGPGPGAGTELVRTVVEGYSVTSNMTLDQQLEKGFKLSGTITPPAGFLTIGGVDAIDSAGSLYSGTFNFLTNMYEVILPAGNYDLKVCSVLVNQPGSSDEGVLPLQGGHEDSTVFLGKEVKGVQVSDDTSRNITLDPVTIQNLSGSITNTAELPTGVLAGGNALLTLSSVSGPTQSLALIQPDGSFSTGVAPGSYVASVVVDVTLDSDGDGFPETPVQAASLYNIGQVSVSEASAPLATADFPIPTLIDLSGVVSQPQTGNFSEALVFAGDRTKPLGTLLEKCFPVFGGSFSTADANGNYLMPMIQNRAYEISASVPATAIGTPNQGTMSTTATTQSYVVNSVLNIPLPGFPSKWTISGTVTDPDGLPVAGAIVSAAIISGLAGAPDSAFGASATTNTLGQYSLEVLEGTNYRITFEPPITPFIPGF